MKKTKTQKPCVISICENYLVNFLPAKQRADFLEFLSTKLGTKAHVAVHVDQASLGSNGTPDEAHIKRVETACGKRLIWTPGTIYMDGPAYDQFRSDFFEAPVIGVDYVPVFALNAVRGLSQRLGTPFDINQLHAPGRSKLVVIIGDSTLAQLKEAIKAKVQELTRV